MSHISLNTFSVSDGPTWRERETLAPLLGKEGALATAREEFRSRFLFVLLCGVLFSSMSNGLVKQAFNWSQIAYIALDVPWVIFLLVWFIWPRPPSRQGSGGVGILLIIMLVYSVVQMGNPLLDTPFMAIAAIRNRLLPILYFWVGKDLLTAKRANSVLIFCFVIAAGAAAFGILEWKVGLVAVTRWGKGFVPRTSLAWRTADGESVLRPLSIYQDAGIAALFGGAVLFCLSTVYAGRRLDLATWVARGCGILCLALVAVSGVRAAVLCTAQGLLATAFLSTRRIIPMIFMVLAGFAVMVATGAFDKLAERYETILNPVDAYSKNRGDIALSFVDLLSYSPMGYGTGAASPANTFYAKTFAGIPKATDLHSDNGYGILLAEGGIPLTLLYIVLLGTIMWQAWLRRRARGPEQSVAHGVFAFTAIVVMWSATALPIDWQPTNLVFWLLVGGMFAGKAPDRPAKAAAAETVVVEGELVPETAQEIA